MSPLAMRPGLSISRMIDNAVSDLPLPDSPTRHSVSPAATPKLTSITAGTNRPPNSKPVVRWLTERSRDSGLGARDSRSVPVPTLALAPSPEARVTPPESRAPNPEPRELDIDFLVLAEHCAHGVGDLADG